MKITASLFEAFLKCPTKCHLRSLGETGSGNEYAEWVRTQNESYEREAVRRLQETVPEIERVIAPPATENLKTAKWRLAVDLVAQTPDRSAYSHVRELETDSKEERGPGDAQAQPGSSGRESAPSIPHESQSLLTSAATIIESRIHVVERVPSEGRGKAAQFIPIRFIYRNKLTPDDKLLLAFDALVLSQALGREVSFGKIIHGDLHGCVRSSRGDEAQTSASVSKKSAKIQSLLTSAATQPQVLKVKTSALAGEVRKRLVKITALLSGQTNARNAESLVRESLPNEETRGLGGPRSCPRSVTASAAV